MKKLAILVLSAAILSGVGIHLYWLDGIVGYLCEIIFGETVYSTEYRESDFRRLKIGMTEEQVLKLLGEPLFKNPYHPDVWFYSYGKPVRDDIGETNSDYTERIVKFGDGVVIEIHHAFYFE